MTDDLEAARAIAGRGDARRAIKHNLFSPIKSKIDAAPKSHKRLPSPGISWETEVTVNPSVIDDMDFSDI